LNPLNTKIFEIRIFALLSVVKLYLSAQYYGIKPFATEART